MIGKWVKVGDIGVDSATVFIGDPSYLHRPDHPLAQDRIDWRELCGGKYPVLRELGRGVFSGAASYGVLSSTGWGDGIREKIGRGKTAHVTKRVAELRVVFLDVEVESPTIARARAKRGAVVQVGSDNRMVVHHRRPEKKKKKDPVSL